MSVTIRSLSIAKETTFGSLSASTNLPDLSALTFVSIPCERDPIVIAGEPPISERNDTRDGAFTYAPEPSTVYSGGNRVQHRTGSISVTVDLTGVGSSAADYTSNYLGFILGAGLKTQTAQAGQASTVQSVNEYTPNASATDPAEVGNLVSFKGARSQYSAITDNADGSGYTTVSPAFDTDFTGTQTVRQLQTWYPGSRTATGTRALTSVALRVDGVNFQSTAVGCVLESMSISTDNGRLMGEFTFQSAHIFDTHSAAVGPIEPSFNAGSPPFFRNSEVILSATAPTSLTNATTGDKLGRISLDCDDFTFSLTNTLTPVGSSKSVLAMTDMEITDTDAELTLTVSSVNTAILNDFRDRVLRQVIVGTGPTGDGKGCAIMLSAAYLTVDPSQYDVSGNDIVRQQLTYKPSRFGGDVVETGAGNSPIRFGLGV